MASIYSFMRNHPTRMMKRTPNFWVRLDNAAKEIIPNAVVHSLFCLNHRDGKPIAAFDVDIDDKTTIDNKTFFSKMQQKMVTCDPNLNLWITIDREYTSHLTEESPSSYFTLNDDVSI